MKSATFSLCIEGIRIQIVYDFNRWKVSVKENIKNVASGEYLTGSFSICFIFSYLYLLNTYLYTYPVEVVLLLFVDASQRYGLSGGWHLMKL